jgi:hypothetical protein
VPLARLMFIAHHTLTPFNVLLGITIEEL